MAKETSLKPWLLFIISAMLLMAGWLMKSFPIFIFAGLSPLIAIMNRVQEGKFWNHAELVLASLALGFFAAHFFEPSFLVICLVQAIIMTLAFIGASFANQNLGTGMWAIPLFWLSLEYLILLSPWRNSVIYLGDALSLKGSWLHWSSTTGYAGISLWVLAVNYLVYESFFKENRVRLPFLGLTVLVAAGPVAVSYFEPGEVLSRTDMIKVFGTQSSENYMEPREVIYTATLGISVFLLMAALIRNKMK